MIYVEWWIFISIILWKGCPKDREGVAGMGLPKVAELQSHNRSHAFHALEFLYQSLKAVGIVNLNREVAREKAIIGIDRNASQKKFLFLGNDTGDISDNTKVIISHDTECHAILRLSLTAPPRLDDTIAKT